MQQIIEMVTELVEMPEERFNQIENTLECQELSENGKGFFKELLRVAQMKRKEQK